MEIRQIQVGYDKLQDRVLLRMSTTAECEFRFWLTRRFVKRLWGLLVKLLEQDKAVRQQIDEDTRRTVLGIQHEGFVQQGDFSRDFEERPYHLPLGKEPVLLAQGEGKQRDDGAYVLGLHTQDGKKIDIALDTKLLHLVSKLLSDAVARADWDIKLVMLHTAGETPTAEAPAPRRFN